MNLEPEIYSSNIMTSNKEVLKDFDKWFNHGTKKEPRFAYASGVYKEVQDFLISELNRREREVAEEIIKIISVTSFEEPQHDYLRQYKFANKLTEIIESTYFSKEEEKH